MRAKPGEELGCVADQCEKARSRHAGRGLCQSHYVSARRSGLLNDYPKVTAAGVPKAEKAVGWIDFTDDCWEWTGTINQNGYGVLASGSRREYAHRWAWEFSVGPIPEGLTIDHLCLNKKCVNPDHLEVVTLSENSRRRHSGREFCARGHSMADAYVRPKDGWRMCTTCQRDRRRREWANREMVACSSCGRVLSDINMSAHVRGHCKDTRSGGNEACPNNRASQIVPYMDEVPDDV